MSDKFTFDEGNHEYKINGKLTPSVTQVISSLNDFTGIPLWVLENKAALGQEFHRIINLHWLDNLRYDTIDIRLVKSFDSFLAWSNPRLEEFRKGLSEYRMFDKKNRFAGTCDLALPGEIFDWKLRPPNPIVDILQLDAYDTLLGGCKRKRWSVCFDIKSGRMKITRSEHDQARAVFLYMLEYYHSEEKDEKKHFELLENWKGEFN